MTAGPREHFDIKGKWQGHVVSVGEETFTAIIEDVLGQSPDEEVEIYLEEISPDDRPLVVPGAHFYWAIGYRDVIGGYRMRASLIKMQRLPGWTADDCARINSATPRAYISAPPIVRSAVRRSGVVERMMAEVTKERHELDGGYGQIRLRKANALERGQNWSVDLFAGAGPLAAVARAL